MLSTLISLARDSWDAVSPFVVVDEFEAGVILRLGKFHRLAPPGLCWKIPLIDDILTANTAITTMQLDPQTLVTSDGAQVVTVAIIKYAIKDVKTYLLDIIDPTDVLNDVVLGSVQQEISNTNYHELIKDITAIENKVLSNTRKEVNHFGFKIIKITFGTIGKIKSIRLITNSPPELED